MSYKEKQLKSLTWIFCVLMISVLSQEVQKGQDKWRFCQMTVKNKEGEEMLMCDMCFLSSQFHHYGNGYPQMLKYENIRKLVFENSIQPYNFKLESLTLPALEVDLKVKEVKDVIAILEKLSEKENQNTDGVFFLLNIEGPCDSEWYLETEAQMNGLKLTFPVFTFGVCSEVFPDTTESKIKSIFFDDKTEQEAEDVTVTVDLVEMTLADWSWTEPLVLLATILVQLGTTLAAYFISKHDRRVGYFLQGRVKYPRHEHSAISDCPITIYVAKLGIISTSCILIIFGLLFVLSGFIMQVMRYVYWVLFAVSFFASTTSLWIRLVNYVQVLRCDFSKCRRFSIAFIPPLLIGGCMFSLRLYLDGMDVAIFITDLTGCILITALLMHFELMSFWSLLLYALGMLGLELMITYVEVPTGLEVPEVVALSSAIYNLDFENEVRSLPALMMKTNESEEYIMMRHSNTTYRNPFFITILHMHASERVCQLPMHIVIDIWSVLVPGVVVLYLCNYNERKSMKPSKLYVALTFSIMAMGQILEISLQMRLEDPISSMVCSVPLLLIYALIGAAARKEFRFFVFAKNTNNSIEMPSNSLMMISGEPEWTPGLIQPFDHTSLPSRRSFHYPRRTGGTKMVTLDGNKTRKRTDAAASRKVRKPKRSNSVPKSMKYKPGRSSQRGEVTLERIRLQRANEPMTLPELSTLSVSKWLDLTYLTYY